MRVLITGANGILGRALSERLGGAHTLYLWGRGEADLTDQAQVRAAGKSIAFEAVVHAAAMTNVDGCESEPERAMAVNRDATRFVADLARERGATVVYVSTDYVFDGSKGSPYLEEDPTHPINAYGRTKLAGEEAARASGAPCLVVRTSWLFGAGGKNFVRDRADHLGEVPAARAAPQVLGPLGRAIPRVGRREPEAVGGSGPPLPGFPQGDRGGARVKRVGAIRSGLEEGARLLLEVLARDGARIERMAKLFGSTLARGRTIFFCGNGGSAAEAQHFAAELVGRFVSDRRALPAVALTTDSSILTSVGNDYGFSRVFSRQIEALGRRGDLLVVLTTSGKSPNVLAAVRAARARGLRVAGLTGARGAAFARRCDLCIVVPSRATPRVQEVHLALGHLCCERAEEMARR